MKIFAVTTFIILFVTAIFLTNSYVTRDQESSSIEETNDLLEVEAQNQDLLTEEHLEKKDVSPIYSDDQHQSLENKHGIPSEFLELHPKADISADSEQSLTSKAIKETYTEKFQHLEAATTIEIASLVELAANDYKSKKQNDEKISYFYFYNTYYPKLTKLQNEIDSAFERQYSDLQNELAKHGFSTDKAEKFKQEYELKKNQQLKEMMISLVDEF